MRDSPNFVRALDYVALSDGKIIGVVVFMKSFIAADNGCKYEVLCMGPIAVVPEYQRKGIGGMLITHTRKIATELGYRAILLCGDPEYYSKMGFVAAELFGIRTSENNYAAALQVCPLYPDALTGITGKYYEDGIYNIDPVASETFDRLFPKKERIAGTPSQRRFQEVVAMQKPANPRLEK